MTVEHAVETRRAECPTIPVLVPAEALLGIARWRRTSRTNCFGTNLGRSAADCTADSRGTRPGDLGTMSSSPGATYATGERARCIASVPGNGEQTVFAVGTQRLRGNNAVHFVAHDRDRDALVARGVYKHHPEIWDLQPSPTSDALVATLYNPSSPSQNHGGAVWRVPGDGEDTSGSKALESVAPFPETNGAARCVRWRVGVGVDPSAPATGGTLAVADEKTLRLFQLDASSNAAMAIAATSDSFGDEAPGAPVAGAWDPHTTTSFAIVSGTHGASSDDGVCVYDTRTMRVSLVIPNPPSSRRAGCRFADVEFDPRRPNKAFTAGDDGLARAWDLRKPTDPTSVFAGHEHWVRRVCANPVYDLLVTASADGTARLWRHGETCDTREDDEERKTNGSNGNESKTKMDDDDVGPVETYGAPGGTSVCGVAWSFADPWSFASLEGDGAVALRVVPRAEKYRILL